MLIQFSFLSVPGKDIKCVQGCRAEPALDSVLPDPLTSHWPGSQAGAQCALLRHHALSVLQCEGDKCFVLKHYLLPQCTRTHTHAHAQVLET